MQVLKSVPVRFLHSIGTDPRIDDVPGVVAVPALGVVLLDVCAPAIVAMPTDNAPASNPGTAAANVACLPAFVKPLRTAVEE